MTGLEIISTWRNRALHAYTKLAETFASARNSRDLQNRLTCWSLPGAMLAFVFPDKTSLIVDPCTYDRQLKSAFDDMLRTMAPVDFSLTSHLHEDHYDPAVLRLLNGELGCSLLVPAPICAQVEKETGLRGPITAVETHERTLLSSEIGLRAFESAHLSIDHSFGFILQAAGKKIVITSDIRDYGATQVPSRGYNADIMFFSMWLGTMRANDPDPQLVLDAAKFIRGLAPKRVVFYHLYDTGRDLRDTWQDQHCTLVRDALGWPADRAARLDFGSPIYL